MRVLATTFAVCLAAGATSSARAAYPTRAMSAVEKTKALPDIHLGASFTQDSKRAKITREWVQDENGQRTALDVKELNFEEITRSILLDLRVGLYHDLEFHLRAPFILQNDSKIGFQDGVQGRSTIIGSANADDRECVIPGSNTPCPIPRYPITEVPAERNRSGLGDMTFGLSWSPLVDTKDEAYPTLTLTADIIAPTGKVRDPVDGEALPGGSGGSVGLGQTTFDLSLALSKRMREATPAFDPYVILGARIPVPTPKQKDRGYDPAPSGRFVVGSEIVLYEESVTQQLYALDLSFGLNYVGIGRTYSELSDYLPNFDQTAPKNNRPGGTNIPIDAVTYDDFGNAANYTTRIDGRSCGNVMGVPCGELNRVDEHLSMSGTFAVHLRPAQFFVLRAGASVSFTTDHLITAEKVGTDLDDPVADANADCNGSQCVGRVNASNSDGLDERSKYYDPRYDTPGRRLRAEEIINLGFFVTAIATF